MSILFLFTLFLLADLLAKYLLSGFCFYNQTKRKVHLHALSCVCVVDFGCKVTQK